MTMNTNMNILMFYEKATVVFTAVTSLITVCGISLMEGVLRVFGDFTSQLSVTYLDIRNKILINPLLFSMLHWSLVVLFITMVSWAILNELTMVRKSVEEDIEDIIKCRSYMNEQIRELQLRIDALELGLYYKNSKYNDDNYCISPCELGKRKRKQTDFYKADF